MIPIPLRSREREKRHATHTKIFQKDAETRRNSAGQSEKNPPCPRYIANQERIKR